MKCKTVRACVTIVIFCYCKQVFLRGLLCELQWSVWHTVVHVTRVCVVRFILLGVEHMLICIASWYNFINVSYSILYAVFIIYQSKCDKDKYISS